ncbi:COP9 signalosome (CSN) subunit [Nowakowskiella sp. JEL0407]|nr:COP9 signalosome (CSN) subunit [Nowakowskiella sp. JEL0407]
MALRYGVRLGEYVREVGQAILDQNPLLLANYLKCVADDHLAKIRNELLHQTISDLDNIVFSYFSRLEKNSKPLHDWAPIIVAHLSVVYHITTDDIIRAATLQRSLCDLLHDYFQSQSNWLLKCVYVVNRDVTALAIQADEELRSKGKKANMLEDAARTINKAFTYCITDRFSLLEESRRWGTYYISALLMKTYFRLKQINLCSNILKAIAASDLPELREYPLSHQITFRYFLGILAFKNEEFIKAEIDLSFVLERMIVDGSRLEKKLLVLTHLIPIKMLSGILPTHRMLQKYPLLADIFAPFISAIKTGNVRLYDESLNKEQKELIQRGVYLVIEKCRSLCVRVLFKKVWLILEKSSKIQMSVFQKALHMAGTDVDGAEVECMLANMIDKGYIKGYLSHELQYVVLSQRDPFPAFSSISLFD